MEELGIDERQLFYLEFVNRENHFRHAGRGQELLEMELLRDANPQAVEHGDQTFREALQGRVSRTGEDTAATPSPTKPPKHIH